MGTLNDRFQYVWYGTCGEPSCSELLFSSMSSDDLGKIDSISTLENTGFVRYDPSSSETSTLDRLRCGKMYLVTLNHSAVASGGLEIPNALASSSMSKLQGYGISTTCSTITTPTPSPSPTPVKAVCIPDGYTQISHSSTPVDFGGMGNIVFGQSQGFLGFNPLDFSDSVGASRQYTILLPDGSLGAFVTATNWPENDSDSPTIYFEQVDGTCYGGNLALMVGSEPSREVTLELQ